MFIDDKVIFIHNPRAAGTSTRRALCMGSDPNQNLPWPAHLATTTTRNRKHLFCSQLSEYFDQEFLDSRFKFAIVRNPWDRLVSLYGLFRRPLQPKYQTKTPNAKFPIKIGKFFDSLMVLPDAATHGTKWDKKNFISKSMELEFNEWVEWCDRYCWNACSYLSIPTTLIRIPQHKWTEGVDRVFKFEELKEVSDFLQENGYNWLGHENHTERTTDWRSFYNNRTYDLVAGVYAEDIKRFGY